MTSTAPTYSVLIPAYCEAESLIELCDRIAAVFAGLGASDAFEIVFVDDGSTDRTAEVLRSLRRKHGFVRTVTLRRNCGKSLALSAGFKQLRGKYIVTLDADLQDHPEDIPRMLAAVAGDLDMVNGWRTDRHDTTVRKIGSRLFNWFVRRSTRLQLHDMNCAMKVYRADVLRALAVYGEYHRYIPLQAHLAGFRVGELPVGNSDRKFGSSKFPTFRYEGFFDLVSLLFLNNYGLSPMHFFGKLSALVMAPSILMLGYFVIEQVLYWMGRGAPVFNRPLLAFALAALLLGGIIFTTGFVCDFVLHHLVRARLDTIIAMNVVRTDDDGENGG